jgi:type IV secretion system protein TrbL
MAAPLNAAVGFGAAAAGGARQAAARVAGHFQTRSTAGARAVTGASGAANLKPSPASAGSSTSGSQPAWTSRFRRSQQMREGVLMAAHTIGAGDGGGASEGPNLKSRE